MSLSYRRSRSALRQHLSNVLNEPENLEDSSEDEEPSADDTNDQEGRGNNSIQDDDDQRPPSRSRNPYEQGTIVLATPHYYLKVKSVSHSRQTRYKLSDHLYSIWIEQRKRGDPAPLLLDLEEALEKAIIHVLNELKSVYTQTHYQIYVTVIDRHIRSGLNSGNYSLQTPSDKIARWMMGMLYNYLKSNQSLRLNSSFQVQIKVLSVAHTNALEQNRTRFRRHIYH